MKSLTAWLSLILFVGIVRATEAPDISQYQVIIDKSPFGSVAASGAAAIQPAFSEHFQFVGIVRSDAGTGPVQAIIYDKEANRSYFKSDGEMIDPNVKVFRIDEGLPYKVILQSLLETATLTFQDRPTTPMPSGAGRLPGVPMPNNPAGVIPRSRTPFRPR